MPASVPYAVGIRQGLPPKLDRTNLYRKVKSSTDGEVLRPAQADPPAAGFVRFGRDAAA